MSTLSNPRLPKGSTILVTGVTGYIGSAVADQALSLGYKVRGSVRNLEKASWLQTAFDSKYPNLFTLALVPEALDTGAVAAAVANVAGIIDTTTDTNMPAEPSPYIPNTILRTLNVLSAAASEPSVKSVVLISSALAANPFILNKPVALDPNSYNEEYVKLAWDPECKDPNKAWMVYGAAKAQQEQEAWKFIAEHKPKFAFNTVLPSTNFGPAVVPEKQGLPSTGAYPKTLFDADLSLASIIPPMHFIDVRDCARLHVAALVNAETNGERLWGMAEPYTWNGILGIFRKAFPERKLVEDLEDAGQDLTKPPSASAKALLRVFGQEEWTGLEQSLLDGLASIGFKSS